MSTTPILNPHQMLQSHLVNCNICKKFSHTTIVDRKEVDGRPGRWFDTTTHEKRHRMLCPVGLRLLELARKDDPNKVPGKSNMVWPFVAKLYERIEARIKGQWVECRVMDKSISARFYYQKEGEDGKLHHRTGAEKIIGYEVETNTGKRAYVNTGDVRRCPSPKPGGIASIGDIVTPPLGFQPGKKLALILRDSSTVEPGDSTFETTGSTPVPSTKFTLHLGG
jgi:hypothetical protein